MITYTTAEIHLDEVKVQFLEKEVSILLIMSVESHTLCNLVTAMIVSAGILTTIGINARLHLEGVDIINNRFQTIREACGMDEQFSRFWITPSKITIVNIDMVIANLIESLCTHGRGLTFDDFFADVECESIP